MKTKIIQIENYLAILTWDKTIKKVYVNWYFFTDRGPREVSQWPAKEDDSYETMENLLNKVKLYAESKKLTLWAY